MSIKCQGPYLMYILLTFREDVVETLYSIYLCLRALGLILCMCTSVAVPMWTCHIDFLEDVRDLQCQFYTLTGSLV